MLRLVQELRVRVSESAAAFRDVFANTDLRRLQLAFLGSELGLWAATVALAVIAFGAGGAAGVAILAVVRQLPAAIAAPFTAILGDRYDRVRVMIGSDLLRAGATAVAAAAAFADAPVAVVFAAASFSSLAATAFRPAEAALLPALARTPAELTAANVTSSTIESVMAFVGPAVGGVLVAVADPGVAFVVCVGTFVWSAFLVSRIGRRARAPEPDGSPEEPDATSEGRLQTATAGFRAIASDAKLRVLIGLYCSQTLVAGALDVLVVVLALKVLDIGDAGYGTLLSALGIGGLIGAAVAAAGLVGQRRLAGAFGVAIVLWGLPIAFLAIWTQQIGALILLGIVGIANTVVDVAGMTILQRSVPDQVLARVFGVLESLVYGTLLLGSVIAATIVEGIGAKTAMIVTGALLPILVALAWTQLRRIDAEARDPGRELDLLRGIPFLAVLPGPSLDELALKAHTVTVPEGAPVIVQGEAGNRFYVISDGDATVSVDGEQRTSLGPGDSFGEIALLRDVPRTATVRAASDLSLLALERDDFIAAVTGHAPSSEAAGAVVSSRLGQRPTGLGTG